MPASKDVVEVIGVGGERVHGAVVIRIRVHVEEPRGRREGRPDRRDRLRVAPLGHVRHGLQHDPYPTVT